jgi:hypothetical protein
MSLNDLKLSPSLLTSLYPSSLINPEATDVVPQSPPAEPVIKDAGPKDAGPEPISIPDTKWKYLGNNQKNILVVVNYDNAVHLPDEELNFLTNMLTACKLSLADVAIVNYYHYQERPYKDFLTEFQSKIVFLFGIEPFAFQLPVSFPPFQVQSLANCTFLYAPALEVQRKDALLKSKLWVSLRTIFGI